jgi:hypothetical protein
MSSSVCRTRWRTASPVTPRGHDPGDREPVILLGQVDQLAQRVQGAAALGLDEGVGQLGPAEDHRGVGLHGPAGRVDSDALPGLGAHVDDDGVVMLADAQPDRAGVELAGLAVQDGDAVGQGGGGGDLAGLPVQGGGQPGPDAVPGAGGERDGDLRAELGDGVGAAVVRADQPVGVLGHRHQLLGLARPLP